MVSTCIVLPPRLATSVSQSPASKKNERLTYSVAVVAAGSVVLPVRNGARVRSCILRPGIAEDEAHGFCNDGEHQRADRHENEHDGGVEPGGRGLHCREIGQVNTRKMLRQESQVG